MKKLEKAKQMIEKIGKNKKFYVLRNKTNFIEDVWIDKESISVNLDCSDYPDHVSIAVRAENIGRKQSSYCATTWHFDYEDIMLLSSEVTKEMLDESHKRLSSKDEDYKPSKYCFKPYLYQVELGMPKIEKFEQAIQKYLDEIKEKELKNLKLGD